jgi:hypothetical protein
VYNKFNSLSIINKGKEQVFNSPQKQSIHPNLEALVFESKSEISLLNNQMNIISWLIITAPVTVKAR